MATRSVSQQTAPTLDHAGHQSRADVEALKRLVRDADILIQNLRPGIVDDFGIGPDAMLAVNPRLIYCSIWLLAIRGHSKWRPASIRCCNVTAPGIADRPPDDPPTFCAPRSTTPRPHVVRDRALAALKQREATGKGLSWTHLYSRVPWPGCKVRERLRVTGNLPKRHGAASGDARPYQIFETRTGRLHRAAMIACS